MSEVRITPDLFLGSQELNRIQKFTKEKFDALMMYQTREYGILRDHLNRISPESPNFKLEFNIPSNNDGKVKLSQKSYAIDALNRLIVKEPQTDITIPNDNKWYWAKISYAYTNKEEGTISVSTTGSLVGVGTKFTEILRGLPDFPISIKFLNSNNNIQEYQVTSVIDDTNATVSGNFISEQNLTYAVVGAFTPGSQKLNSDKLIYRHDSCIDFSSLSGFLVIEAPQDTALPPAKVSGYEFYIARVKNNNGTITIEDKRTEFHKYRWE